MNPHERQLVLDHLIASEARLLKIVQGLSSEQWNFHETPERWSIAENLEHIVALEHFVTEKISEVLQEATQPDKRALASAKDAMVLGLAHSRATKLTARKATTPVGRWPNPADLVAEFRKVRARTIAFAAETQAALRSHFFLHIAFGDLDCYQWLVALGQHGYRHVVQIEDIQAHPAYPKA